MTIRDIARMAGVGVGTVSRVLNDEPSVREETRRKVLAVIERTDFQPSFAARSLRTQSSHTLGLIADEVTTTPFAVQKIRGALDAAWSRGHILLTIDTAGDPDLLVEALDAVHGRRVEGLMYVAMHHQRVEIPVDRLRVPTVLIDCFDDRDPYASVLPDEERGGYEATTHLIDAGHRRIGIVTVDWLEGGVPAARLRLDGYRRALDERGIPFDPQLVSEGDGNARRGFEAAHELLDVNDPPTALFCGTDRIAMGAYEAVKSRGLSIPGDVSIVGFDDQPNIASELFPSLTTMRLPHEEMGRWGVETLLSDAPSDASRTLLPCPLVVRESVAVRA